MRYPDRIVIQLHATQAGIAAGGPDSTLVIYNQAARSITQETLFTGMAGTLISVWLPAEYTAPGSEPEALSMPIHGNIPDVPLGRVADPGRIRWLSWRKTLMMGVLHRPAGNQLEPPRYDVHRCWGRCYFTHH